MATKKIKFEVRNRFSGEVQFTAQISCDPTASHPVKLGLAVKWAHETGARLDVARLDGARLDGASLVGASLDGASLVGARLVGARLDGASLDGASLLGASLVGASLDGASLVGARLDGARLDGASLVGASLSDEALRPFKADHWLTLSSLQCGAADAAHLIAKLRAGEIDGRSYGHPGVQCACLVGTIATGRDISYSELDRGASRPAEVWFTMIRPGDKAGVESGGGYAAQKALEWTLEWCAAHGIDPEALPPAAISTGAPEAA